MSPLRTSVNTATNGSDAAPTIPAPPPIVPSPPLVEIQAPSDLPEGYRLPVKVDNHDYLAVVPRGGVKSGQLFQVEQLLDMPEVYVTSPILPANMAATTLSSGTNMASQKIPNGHWRDGFCDCCQHFSRPIFWCSLCCLSISLGQIMTRLGLTIRGEKKVVDANYYLKPFWFLRAFLISSYIVYILMALFLHMPVGWVFAPLFIYSVTMMVKTRIFIRKSFHIPGSCLGDCCASFWCSCCTLIQMSGHTTDLHENESACCAPTGIRNYKEGDYLVPMV